MKICCSKVQPAQAQPHQSLVNPSRRQLLAWGAAAAPCLCCLPPPPAAAAAAAADVDWAYGGPEGAGRWPGLCASGAAQSPVALPAPSPAATAPWASQPLRPRYPRRAPAPGLIVQNNGHGSPQVNFPRGEYVLEVGERRYGLIQFHFHTPSEHSRIFGGGGEGGSGRGGEGAHAPVEAHLVHKDEATGELAVVAVLMQERRGGNAALAAALAGAPAAPGRAAAAPLPGGLDVRALLPPRLGYATYVGSLTTPPCTEGVRWLVLEGAVGVSPAQVLALQRFGSGGATLQLTRRPEQALNARQVRYFL